jgi:hypothetical protein
VGADLVVVHHVADCQREDFGDALPLRSCSLERGAPSPQLKDCPTSLRFPLIGTRRQRTSTTVTAVTESHGDEGAPTVG